MAAENQRLLRLENRLMIEELNHNFCYYLDHSMNDELIGLFTEDAVYIHSTRESYGREQIKSVFHSRKENCDRTARHLQTGLQITFINDKLATGLSVCMTFADNFKPPIQHTETHLVADFIDEYQLGEDQVWRISKRLIERIFVSENNIGPIGLDR